jgi:hypothetical protein
LIPPDGNKASTTTNTSADPSVLDFSQGRFGDASTGEMATSLTNPHQAFRENTEAGIWTTAVLDFQVSLVNKCNE